ncbi:hypothetical protein JX265_013943 [Neoarthrinium moseri]|uniref:Enoyl reductase (ER) domain-containing protein n=1 Tax=Neoarthrinium moseri TaxID=1658444 RepID=A0A9P9W7Q1_9PEZI|nr:uncharacterized protein JN550_013869 [Neoarthrinium moseri]KAI1847485.1 hypothetical protein JX265_013943 [Neoarthrinium moseri]KAI1856301.1 hypothetical protein JN550_013869 [Neoarthrinium moseri]
MRALRYYGPQDLRLDYDVHEPDCLPHQVKVRPSFCGICGSDLHAYLSPTAIPFKDTPHPITGETWPVTLGHEFSGDVVQVGSEVRNGLAIGHRVAVQPTICCEKCPPCGQGLTNCCDLFGFVGLTGWGGGLSDYVCVDARYVFKLPDSIPSDIGALVEPLAVAWHAVDQAIITPGDSALVMGAGPIGLAVVQCLKARKAGQIIVVEIAESRKDFARQSGATTVIDPQTEDVVSKCKHLCNGQGPDIALDCAGVAASINAACLAVRKKGLIINVALWEEPVPIEVNNLMFGEKRLSAALSYTTVDFQNVITALEGGLLNVEGMITKTITLDRVVEDGFLALMHEKDKNIKVLVNVRA